MSEKKIHKVSRADNNTIVGRTTRCGLSDFYTTKEIESYIWRNVTCKNCLRLKDLKEKKDE